VGAGMIQGVCEFSRDGIQVPRTRRAVFRQACSRRLPVLEAWAGVNQSGQKLSERRSAEAMDSWLAPVPVQVKQG